MKINQDNLLVYKIKDNSTVQILTHRESSRPKCTSIIIAIVVTFVVIIINPILTNK